MVKKDNASVNIFKWAEELSKDNLSFSSKNTKCCEELMSFLEINKYFGVKWDSRSCGISLCDAEKIQPNIELWLKSYGSDDNDKLKLLSDRMSCLFPETGAMFKKYIEKSNVISSAAWRLADYLCFMLHCEISEMNNKELDDLAANMDRELPLNSARLFSEFLTFIREEGRLSNGWLYQFNSRAEREVNGAYTVDEFLKMAYIIFNKEAWQKEKLLEKALNSERDANLWLFVSMHFICGWRGTDIIRLPMPALPFDGETVRKQISAGVFDTESLINELEFRLHYVPMIPQKAEKYDNIPELKLFVPESLRAPMGIILAVATSYHETVEPGKCFVRKAGNRQHIISFFGKEFMNICGGHRFSTRRANKSYLQGIEVTAEALPGKPKGYMLAALARSHKGGFGSLPETTDIYLRDANFSGYRPDFIASQMFERGVFGFIPALMMEMYANNEYTGLPVQIQTELIAEIGINSSNLEGLTKMVENALCKARKSIAEIMKHSEDMRGSIFDILQNIASGNAPGKQEGFLCLMTASGFSCVDAKRDSCIGCGYEIYTKTILHCLSREYSRLVSARKSSPLAEERYAKILKEAVMPAITEIFASMKRLYPDLDVEPMINTLKKGAMLC